MLNTNLVSVIMPAYNPDFNLLSEAIRSVFLQTYIRTELVIGDDGSQTPIESYIIDLLSNIENPNKINVKVVRCNTNKGISHARNHAIKHATGKWLVWLDADDTLQNDCIEKLMLHSTRYNLVIGECNVYEGNTVNRRKPKVYFEEAKIHFKTEKDPFLLNIISLQPQLLLKKDFEEIGCFNESYRYAELTELFLRYLVKNGLKKINFIENAVYNYNRNRENTLTTHRSELFQYRLKALSVYKEANEIYSGKIHYIGRDLLTGFQKYKLSNLNHGKENFF